MLPLAPGRALRKPRALRRGHAVGHRRWTCSPSRCAPPSSSSSTPRPTASPATACELTEVGAVLVGGGELHDRWETLVRRARAALARDPALHRHHAGDGRRGARRPRRARPSSPRCSRAACSSPTAPAFDRRVLRQAFERRGLDWPDPPVLCTVALARRFAPLARQRRLAPLAESLGIEVEVDATARSPTPRRARACSARCSRGCARTRRRSATRCALLAPRRARPRRARAGAHRRRGARPRAGAPARGCPTSRGAARRARRLRLPQRRRAGRSTSASRCALRTRARAHFAASATARRWTAQAETSTPADERPSSARSCSSTGSSSGCARRATCASSTQDRYVYLRCRLDIAFPVLEVAPEPARRARGERRAAARPGARPPSCVEQLNSLFGLRHCGRKLPRAPWPSAYGQMGRCLSPCLGDLDPNLYRRRLDEALALFTGAGRRRRARCSRTSTREMRAAAARRSATSARRGCGAGARGSSVLLERLGGVLRGDARAAAARAARAHPRERAAATRSGSSAGGSPTGARCGTSTTLVERTARGAARRRTAAATDRRTCPPDEVDEARIVAGWRATNAPRELRSTRRRIRAGWRRSRR